MIAGITASTRRGGSVPNWEPLILTFDTDSIPSRSIKIHLAPMYPEVGGVVRVTQLGQEPYLESWVRSITIPHQQGYISYEIWGESQNQPFEVDIDSSYTPVFDMHVNSWGEANIIKWWLETLSAPDTLPSSVKSLGGLCKIESDVTGWDVSNVETFATTFGRYAYREPITFNQDISGWDVSSATNMSSMFKNNPYFNQDLSGWCVSNISSEPYAFSDDTTSWTLPKPIWGTCPQRFIRLDYRDAVEGSVGTFSAFGKYNGDLISGQSPAFLGEPVYRNGFYYHPVVYTNGSQSFTIMRISQEPEIDFNGSSGQSVLNNLDGAGLDRIEVTYAGVVSNYVVPRSSYTPSGNFLEIQAGPWPTQIVYNNCKNNPVGNFIKLFWN